MRTSRAIRSGLTQHFVLLCCLLTGTSIAVPALVVAFTEAEVQSVNLFVDTTVKAAALVVGAAWTLNRYYTHRIDEVQLDVTLESHFVPSDSQRPDLGGLVIFRIDVLNTGRVVLPSFGRMLEVAEISPVDGTAHSERLHRWPMNGTHPGEPVEPGSWIGLSDAVAVSLRPLVLRYYLEIEFEDGNTWTWHKMLPTTKTTPA